MGRQPTTTDIIKRHISVYSIDVFKRRFGSWRKALEAFVEYINSEDDEDSLEINNITDLKQITINDVLTNEEKLIAVEHKKITQGFKHRTSRNINTRLRFKVLQRDHFKCCACGASPAKDPSVELHIDHIVPWSKGGETVEDNLQTLCSKCNLGKSNVL